MSSSIFSFEYPRRYAALPRRDKRRHILSCALLLAAALVAFRVPEWVYGRYGCRRATFRTGAVQALSPHIRVLGVGSSHVLGGLEPTLFSVPMMNLASPGLNYVGTEAVLKAQLVRVPNLEVVVIEWDDVPLTADTMLALNRDYRAYLELGLEPWQLPARNVWHQLRVMADATIYPIVNLPRLTPQALRERSAGGCSSESGALFAGAGFAPQNRTLNRNKYVPTDFFKALTSMAADRAMTRLNYEALIRTVDMLRARGIKVALLQLPHHKLYWQAQPDILRQAFANSESALRKRYMQDHDVKLWKWGRRADFVDADFADGDHLNLSGADRLSRLLDQSLRPLLKP